MVSLVESSLFSARGIGVSGTCVIGLQWGDEAKGKLVDLLTARFDIVVRYQGGANAGHTVVVGNQTYKLHHIPSGILNPQVMNVVTPGVVLNPPTLLQEIDSLLSRQVKVAENLMLSERAHVVFPWHIAEDKALNADPGEREGIGTTLRGIGPCYRDKVGRIHALRLGDMYRSDFEQRVHEIVAAKNRLLLGLSGHDASQLDAAAIHREYAAYAERLRIYVGDTTNYLLDEVEAGRKLLFEGAQGSLLDIDHGTFPYVTSSNASGVGVSSGSGVPGRWITHVIGVCKAYSTRVGGGPFPTEQDNAEGQRIRELGREYGTTTGRPRRCGWFDAVAVRYTARLSGIDGIALMMMDVLSQLPEIKVCVAYELDGRRIERFPSHADDLRRVQPIYETFPGWQVDVTGVRQFRDLPDGAKRYIDRISALIGKPVEIVSVGPDREQTMRTDGTPLF
jgi:adenylosuccinate synthase